MKYAGFWRRLSAFLVDSLLVAFPSFIILSIRSRALTLIMEFPLVFLSAAYSIYFHGKWGKTVGKMVANIKVVTLDGDRVTWEQAFLRRLVDLSLAVLIGMGDTIALSRIPEAEYRSLGILDLGRKLISLRPPAECWVIHANALWFWAGLLVLLLNQKRRSLHDFIAGTVVIDEGHSHSGNPIARPNKSEEVVE